MWTDSFGWIQQTTLDHQPVSNKLRLVTRPSTSLSHQQAHKLTAPPIEVDRGEGASGGSLTGYGRGGTTLQRQKSRWRDTNAVRDALYGENVRSSLKSYYSSV